MALVEINSQIVSEAIEKQSLARLTLDIDGSVITTRADGGVGVSGIQSAPSQGPFVLSDFCPSGADRPYPASKESSGQCPRFSWSGGVCTGVDRRCPSASGEYASVRVPHGRSLFSVMMNRLSIHHHPQPLVPGSNLQRYFETTHAVAQSMPSLEAGWILASRDSR